MEAAIHPIAAAQGMTRLRVKEHQSSNIIFGGEHNVDKPTIAILPLGYIPFVKAKKDTPHIWLAFEQSNVNLFLRRLKHGPATRTGTRLNLRPRGLFHHMQR